MTSLALIFRSGERLEIDENASAVERGVDAVRADERRQAFHRRVFQNHLRERLLPFGHRGERNIFAASEMP
jgi:hypothetical protein